MHQNWWLFFVLFGAVLLSVSVLEKLQQHMFQGFLTDLAPQNHSPKGTLTITLSKKCPGREGQMLIKRALQVELIYVRIFQEMLGSWRWYTTESNMLKTWRWWFATNTTKINAPAVKSITPLLGSCRFWPRLILFNSHGMSWLCVISVCLVDISPDPKDMISKGCRFWDQTLHYSAARWYYEGGVQPEKLPADEERKCCNGKRRRKSNDCLQNWGSPTETI